MRVCVCVCEKKTFLHCHQISCHIFVNRNDDDGMERHQEYKMM